MSASILGHRTRHCGDVAAQARESLTNIAAVVAEANRLARSAPYRIDELAYRVYLRHATDFQAVRDVLNAMLGAAAPVAFSGSGTQGVRQRVGNGQRLGRRGNSLVHAVTPCAVGK